MGGAGKCHNSERRKPDKHALSSVTSTVLHGAGKCHNSERRKPGKHELSSVTSTVLHGAGKCHNSERQYLTRQHMKIHHSPAATICFVALVMMCFLWQTTAAMDRTHRRSRAKSAPLPKDLDLNPDWNPSDTRPGVNNPDCPSAKNNVRKYNGGYIANKVREGPWGDLEFDSGTNDKEKKELTEKVLAEVGKVTPAAPRDTRNIGFFPVVQSVTYPRNWDKKTTEKLRPLVNPKEKDPRNYKKVRPDRTSSPVRRIKKREEAQPKPKKSTWRKFSDVFRWSKPKQPIEQA